MMYVKVSYLWYFFQLNILCFVRNSICLHFCGGLNVCRNKGQDYYMYFGEILVYVKGILIILIMFYFVLSFTLLCSEFSNAKKTHILGHTLCHKFSLCRKYDILLVGSEADTMQWEIFVADVRLLLGVIF